MSDRAIVWMMITIIATLIAIVVLLAAGIDGVIDAILGIWR